MSADTDRILKPADSAGSSAAAPAPGNPAPQQTPAGGQPDKGGPADGKGQGTGTPPDGSSKASDGTPAEPAVLSQEELDHKAKEILGLAEAEPNTADHWKKKYEASSKEGREKAAELKALSERLSSLGLKAVQHEKGIDFIADEKYVAPKSESLVVGLFDKLTQADKDLAMDDPKRFATLIVAKTLEATQRPAPTADSRDIKIPEPVRAQLRKEVAETKSKEDGRKNEFPDFEALEPYINAIVADPSTPKEFTDFAMRSEDNYRFAMKLLYGRVHQRVAPLIAAQLDAKRQLEAKKAAATQDASLTSEGTRAPKSRQSDSAKREADEVAKAGPVW